jgi:DNA primase
LRFQKIELEREIAEATEAGDETIELLLRALAEVQFEILRMENQEAIIDGFGVLSGRVKGAAVSHG